MGNALEVENLKSYETASTKLFTGSQEGTDEGTQLDLYRPAHESYFKNLVTAEEKQVFRGLVVEDTVEKSIMSTFSKEPMNINLNSSTKPVLEQKPPEVELSVPKISSQCIANSPPSLDNGQIQKPWKSEILAAEVESREDDTEGKNKVTGPLIREETANRLPPVLGFSSGRFPRKSPLKMVSMSTHLTVFSTICSDGNHIAHQEQMGDQETIGANQTFKATDTNANNQGRSLAIGNSTGLEALCKTTQPQNNVLIPLDSSQDIEQMHQSHPLFASISSALESIREYSSTELLINTPGIEDGDDGKITQETAATECTKKVNPDEDESTNIPQLSPYNIQAKTQEETQVKSIICFSYADALKRKTEISQPKGAPKPPGKNEQGLIIQPKFAGHQNSTRVKAGTAKAPLSSRRQNSTQENSKTHVNSNKITPSWNLRRPSAVSFNYTKAQPRFEWTSTCYNPKDHFQFKGSWNMTKPRAFTPKDSIQSCRRNVGRNTVQHTINSGSSRTVPKKSSTGMPREEAKPKEYKSYPIARNSTVKLDCKFSPTCEFEEPVKGKAGVSVQPQDVGLQTPESTLPKKPSSKNLSVATLETPEPVKPDVPQAMPQSDIREDTKTSVLEEHGDPSNISNSCSSASPRKETTESNDQIPDQTLVVRGNEMTSEPTTNLDVPVNGGMKNDPVPDVVPKNNPSGRWEPFYVDRTCTMKCRSRHNPGKLPPNVVRWFSVAENKLAEPEWITTLKVMCSLVAGTKFAMDHHSLYMMEKRSTKSKKRHT